MAYSSGQKCMYPSHGSNVFGFLAEVALPASAEEQVGEPAVAVAAAAVAAALGQRKKLLLPSSMSFSSGSKPT